MLRIDVLSMFMFPYCCAALHTLFFFVSFDLKDSLRRNLIYSPSGGFVSFHTDIACNCMLCLSKYKHHRRLVEQLQGADRGHLALDSQTRMQHLSIAKGEKRYDT